jgi:hypothetical protein
MTVSETLQRIADSENEIEDWNTLLEACDKEGFDLNQFLFEIWKETYQS